MGRYSTGKPIHEECKRLEMSFLRKQGALKPNIRAMGEVQWEAGGRDMGGIGYMIDTRDKYIRLAYNITATGEDIQQDIYLSTVPSNIGRGHIWYFHCPYTGRRCRVLYITAGSKHFRSRQAYNGLILYRSQTHSKLSRWNERYWRHAKQIAQLTGNGYTPTYNGKPTATARRVESLQQKHEKADEERWALHNLPKVIRRSFQAFC